MFIKMAFLLHSVRLAAAGSIDFLEFVWQSNNDLNYTWSFVLQNLAEAEYVVAMFMYMRLLGYPAEKITILTTYNGQKHLLRDVVRQRCGDNPLIGRPHKVTTTFFHYLLVIVYRGPCTAIL